MTVPDAARPGAVLLLALAVLVWPVAPGRHRLRRLRPQRCRGRDTPERLLASVTVVASAGAGLVLAGVGGALAAAILVTVARTRWRRHRAAEDGIRATAGLAEALRLMVSELRAGAHPAAAAEGAAVEAEPSAARLLTRLAAAARLGGDVGAALQRIGAEHPGSAFAAGRLARTWTLAERHGVPLADLLDAVRADLEHRARFARQVRARMAGPRATAAVLAGLPVFGLLLGEAIGGRPWHVLSSTTTGQVLLVVGVLLVGAGLRWSEQLTERAVLP
ncbi:MAG TPA: type II secretion system F family protein [Pseudonocardiaceae bacterium]